MNIKMKCCIILQLFIFVALIFLQGISASTNVNINRSRHKRGYHPGYISQYAYPGTFGIPQYEPSYNKPHHEHYDVDKWIWNDCDDSSHEIQHQPQQRPQWQQQFQQQPQQQQYEEESDRQKLQQGPSKWQQQQQQREPPRLQPPSQDQPERQQQLQQQPQQVQDQPQPQQQPTEVNPCSLPYLKKPDFSAPGRRISETKCYEYIWEVKFRQDKADKEAQCKEYRKTHRNPNEEESFFTIQAIGGRDALPGEFPHMAAVGWKAAIGTWIFKCGSTLISSNFVLTAAHCTKAPSIDTTVADPIPKIVRIGDKNIIDKFANGIDPLDVVITRIIVHPQYKAPKKYYDIALMELSYDVTFDKNVQPACLWNKFDTSSLGKEATLTGWGVIETAGRTTSPTLQAAVVDVVSSKQCDGFLRPKCNRNWCGVQEHQLCAGKLAGGVDSCQGDSGGPLQVKIQLPPTAEGAMHYVIGVTSFGFGCALSNTPGVYTRVSSFIDWIEPIVWNNTLST